MLLSEYECPSFQYHKISIHYNFIGVFIFFTNDILSGKCESTYFLSLEAACRMQGRVSMRVSKS